MNKTELNAPEVVCVGQAVIDCITRGMQGGPGKPGKARAQSITLNPGGDALNEAAVLSGMGRRVRLVCGVGDDLAGSFIRDTAAQRGVLTDGITTIRGMVTPVADMFVNLDGTRSSVSSEATLLPGYTPDPELLRGAAVVSFASLFRAPLDQAETVCALVRAAKESGAVICADTKLPTFRELSLDALSQVLPMIDYFFPNETEAAFYSGHSDPEEMGQALLDRGIRNVIIKAGEKGCYAFSQEDRFLMPAIEVPAVDTTGAGDNFVAGFIDSLLRGRGLREACAAGTKAAAESIQHLGAI